MLRSNIILISERVKTCSMIRLQLYPKVRHNDCNFYFIRWMTVLLKEHVNRTFIFLLIAHLEEHTTRFPHDHPKLFHSKSPLFFYLFTSLFFSFLLFTLVLLLLQSPHTYLHDNDSPKKRKRAQYQTYQLITYPKINIIKCF